MEKSLLLNDVETRRVLSRFNLEPSRRIGRGRFCAVYEKDQGRAVYKLTTSLLQRESLRDTLTGAHFPKFIEDYGFVGLQSDGKGLYLFTTDRLTPLSKSSSQVKSLAKKLLVWWKDYLWSMNGYYEPTEKSTQLQGLESLEQDTTFPDSFRESIGKIIKLAYEQGDELIFDLHRGNLMSREDELILNDVVVHRDELIA